MLRFKLHHLFSLSLLVTTLCHSPAQAMGINFELKEQSTSSLTSQNTDQNTLETSHLTLDALANFEPLPIPPKANRPPINTRTSKSPLPGNVIATRHVLTPPPSEALPTFRVLAPNHSPSPSQAIGLNFTPTAALPTASSPLASATRQPASTLPNWIYDGGSDSLVARSIGSAEGTRTATGKPTQAYYGHTDPGNGVWNMGTFSYQHGARSPQEADKKQLTRLKQQGKTIAHQADQAELTMTLGELLNGLDLANQSPRAALERGGYIERLAQARKQGMKHGDAIVWARTYSYLDPDTQRWNAPGLGNTLHSIQRDQNRRHEAVAQAFHHYQAQRQTNKPLEKTLTTPAVASIEHSLQTAAAPENVLSESMGPESQDSPVNVDSSAAPLEFKIAESLGSNKSKVQHDNEPEVIPPNSDTELSQASTSNSSMIDSSHTRTNLEIEDTQIHS